MKQHQRLDYGRIAEVLSDRGMVDQQALQEALQTSQAGGLPFPEALIGSNLVGDWDLSAIVSEVYNLPFLSVDMVSPDLDASSGLDLDFLKENALVPLGRHGDLITVCMPAIVPAEVLGMLAATTDLFVLPVVGTVRTNRRWIEENLSAFEEGAEGGEGSGEWSSIFDEGNAAVLSELEHVTDVDDDEMSLDDAIAATEDGGLPPLPEGSLESPSAPLPADVDDADAVVDMPELNLDPPA